jgi:hypothetical protein
VKTRILSLFAALAFGVGMLALSSTLLAQDSPSTPSSSQDQQSQTPPPQEPSQSPSSQQPSTQQPPDSGSQAPPQKQTSAGDPSAVQEFVGTVQKTGDKYVLKDDAGKTYDVDSQDQMKKFEGKRVRVKGVLDETGTKIMVR